MNNKRITSTILLISLLCANLAACGSTASGSSDDTTASADTTAVETTAPVEYEKPDVDYGGKTFTIASFNFDFSYAVAKYTMISHEEESGDIIDDSIIKMTRQVEEEMNIKLEMLEMTSAQRNNIDPITKPIYAGEDSIQAAFPLMVGLAKLLAIPSLLTDLDTIPTLDLSHSWWDQNSIEEYNIGGVQYTAIGDICFFAKAAPMTTFFNKQMIADYKLEDPYKLVYDGKWTLDKMIEMSKAAARDVNGNQQVDPTEDQFGFIAAGPYTFLVGCGVEYSKRNGNDIEMTFYSEKTADILAKYIPFERDTTISMSNVDYSGSYKDAFQELFTPTFMENRALFFTNQVLMALDFRAMDTDFGMLPMPKYDEKQDTYYGATNTWWCDNLVVPTTNADLEMTGNVLEAMGYYSQQYVTPAFIETTVLGKSVRDDDSAKMVEMILDNQAYDIALLFNWGNISGMISNMEKDTGLGLASKYAKIEPTIKAEMQKTMDELLDK